MSQQLDSITACNQKDAFLGPFQYEGTAYLSTGNLTGRKTDSGRYPPGLERWSWQKIMGQGNESLRISIFYRPVPPDQRAGPGSAQQSLNEMGHHKPRTPMQTDNTAAHSVMTNNLHPKRIK